MRLKFRMGFIFNCFYAKMSNPRKRKALSVEEKLAIIKKYDEESPTRQQKVIAADLGIAGSTLRIILQNRQIVDDHPRDRNEEVDPESDEDEESPPPPPPRTLAAALEGLNAVRAYFSADRDTEEQLLRVNQLENVLFDESAKHSLQRNVDTFFRRLR